MIYLPIKGQSYSTSHLKLSTTHPLMYIIVTDDYLYNEGQMVKLQELKMAKTTKFPKFSTTVFLHTPLCSLANDPYPSSCRSVTHGV